MERGVYTRFCGRQEPQNRNVPEGKTARDGTWDFPHVSARTPNAL